MKIKEIVDKDVSNLTQELAEKQKHLFELRSAAVTEKLEDPSQLTKTRKDIARIKTVLRQREIEQSRTQTKQA
jgi:large subunit ribosomal protein L29